MTDRLAQLIRGARHFHDEHVDLRGVRIVSHLCREVERAMFSASWERMVLLASSLEYRAAYGVPMPIGDVDHYIPALESALACVGLHHD